MAFAESDKWRTLSKAKQARAIRLQTAKGRAATGLFLIEGFRLLVAALEARWPLDTIIVQDEDHTKERLSRLLAKFQNAGLEINVAGRRIVQKIADTVEPSGVIALGHRKTPSPADTFSGKRLLIVDNVRDPGNLGAIFRSAAAFGVDGVFLSKGTVDVYNPKVVRASMGALFLLPLITVCRPAEVVELLRRQRIALYVADPHTGQTPNQIGKPVKWALVIGGETEGVSGVWRKSGAVLLHIPLSPQVESLNSAVAAGILLYQLGAGQPAKAGITERGRKPRRAKIKTTAK